MSGSRGNREPSYAADPECRAETVSATLSVAIAGGVRLVELSPGRWVRPEEIAGLEERADWNPPYVRVYLRASSSFVEVVGCSAGEIVARLEEERP